MKDKLLLFTFFLASIAAFSQDYQCIRSDQQNYFATPNLNVVLATRTDSIQLQNQDSIFYSFQTIRHNDSTTFTTCDYIKTCNWYGQKVDIRANGENLFFNKNLDTIRIQTEAMLNDTFLVYTFPSGHEIMGYVSQHDTATVLGISDSVKTIQLFSQDTAVFCQDSTVQISKNHGFTKVIPFYSFPATYFSSTNEPISLNLVGTEYPRTGITKRYKSEIYDLQVGDVVQWWRTTIHWNGPYSEQKKEKITITGRTDWGVDSLYLEYERDHIFVDYMNYTTTGASTGSWKVYNLDEFLTPYLPEEFYVDSITSSTPSQIFQNSLKVNGCGAIIETVQNVYVFDPNSLDGNYVPGSNCFMGPGFGVVFNLPNEYVEGGGGFYQLSGETYWNGFGQSHWGGISYMSNSSTTCGTEWFLDLFDVTTVELKIYPNPVKDQLTITANTAENLTINIVDMQGRLTILNNIAMNGGAAVDVSALPSGIYLVQVESEERVLGRKKFVKE